MITETAGCARWSQPRFRIHELFTQFCARVHISGSGSTAARPGTLRPIAQNIPYSDFTLSEDFVVVKGYIPSSHKIRHTSLYHIGESVLGRPLYLREEF